MRRRALLGSICASAVLFAAALAASCRTEARGPGRDAPAAASVTPADRAFAFVAQSDGSFSAAHPVLRMHVTVDGRGATLDSPGEPWHVSLTGSRVLCGATRVDLEPGTPRAVAGNRIETTRRFGSEGLVEWFEHGPRGLEHGFTLSRDPCPGMDQTAIVVSASGLAAVEGGGIAGVELRDARGLTRVRYTNLAARDATGAPLEARMMLEGSDVTLRLTTRGATFPVSVDPLAWVQVAELTASDGNANDAFGTSVAISGNTLLVGAPGKAAAYVYTSNGPIWTLQQEIAGTTPYFGYAVALSGNTAIVGAPNFNGLEGAAFVYTRSGTTWTEQQELTGPAALIGDSGSYPTAFGNAVALQGDIAMVGAWGTGSYQGSAYVFARSASTWVQQQALMPSDENTQDGFGYCVAFDGTNAVITDRDRTVAYFYAQSGTTWTQTQEMVIPETPSAVALAGGTTMMAFLGQGVRTYALSNGTWGSTDTLGVTADGVAFDETTAVVGATRDIYDDSGIGSILVYEWSDAGWTGQQQITPGDVTGNDLFGSPVALGTGTIAAAAPQRRVGANPSQGAVFVEAYGPTPGTPCSTGSECALGYCVDGVCCDSPCAGLCIACAASLQSSGPDGGAPQDGVCGPATAGTNPHSDPCGPDLPATCGRDGLCDGNGACQLYPLTTSCGNCTGNTLNTSNCNGGGACVAGTATACPGNLTCAPDGGACETSCTTDAQCVVGTTCTGGACVPKSGASASCSGPSTSQSADGGITDCAPYLCGATGQCNQACASVRDCVAGTVCDPTSRCVQPPTNAPGPSCGAATGRGGLTPVGACCLVLGLAAVRRARTRRRTARKPSP